MCIYIYIYNKSFLWAFENVQVAQQPVESVIFILGSQHLTIFVLWSKFFCTKKVRYLCPGDVAFAIQTGLELNHYGQFPLSKEWSVLFM